MTAFWPLFRQIWGCVVGFEVCPLSGGQVQPVQVSTVKVARCSSKHIEVAVYDDHCLKMEMSVVWIHGYAYVMGLISVNVIQLQLPVRRSCWVFSLCSWAGSTACTERYKHGRHCRCFHQMESQCHRTRAGCCRVKQLKEREGSPHDQSQLLQFNILGTKIHSNLDTTTNILLMRIQKNHKDLFKVPLWTFISIIEQRCDSLAQCVVSQWYETQ